MVQMQFIKFSVLFKRKVIYNMTELYITVITLFKTIIPSILPIINFILLLYIIKLLKSKN